jgi:DNA-binding response OmpR family regulator
MPKILTVDDDKNVILLVKGILKKEGYEVIEAYSGKMALDVLCSHAEHGNKMPDLILLDIMMPEIDGMETCRRIKGEENTKGIPVIMLTARRDVSDKISGLEAGANDYIVKPFNPDELLARVKAQLRIKFLEDELLKKEKVETIAKMVISIAHEINNPLTVVVGELEMLLMKKEEFDKDTVEKLETVLNSTLRIKDVVTRMTKINTPVDAEYVRGKKMIDIWKSG